MAQTLYISKLSTYLTCYSSLLLLFPFLLLLSHPKALSTRWSIPWQACLVLQLRRYHNGWFCACGLHSNQLPAYV